MSLLNLKEILASDTVAEKLAKINYNFDILVNSSGPVGDTGGSGVNGVNGTVGIEGPVGGVGPIGDPGGIGTTGNSEWFATLYESNSNATYALSPKFNPSNADTTSGISIGHPDIDADSYGAVTDKSQLTIYNNPSYDSDIRFTSQGSMNFFDINFDDNGLLLGFSDSTTSSTINLNSDNLLFSDLNDNTIISANTTDITFSKNTSFNNSNVEINLGLKLDFGAPAVDKIACSSDADGNVEWKSLSEIVNAIPTGMIVPILSDILSNPTNFVQEHSFTITSTSASEMWTGRGTGDYVGWYICNGKTWSNASGDSFDTPDLNSFEYTIDVAVNAPVESNASNNLGQFDASLSDVDPNIVSNSALTSNSESNGTNFDFNMSIDSDSISAYIGDSSQTSHSEINLIRVPHVIYLGETDLTWSDSGIVKIKLIYNSNTIYGDSGSYVPTYIYKKSIEYLYAGYPVVGGVNSDNFLITAQGNVMSNAEYNSFLSMMEQRGIANEYEYRFFSSLTAQSHWAGGGMTNNLREGSSSGANAYTLDTSTGFIYQN
jgi:hypothetical protein